MKIPYKTRRLHYLVLKLMAFPLANRLLLDKGESSDFTSHDVFRMLKSPAWG